MSASLNELIFNLNNIERGGILSDDENMSEEQLKFIFNYVRAVVIKRDADKSRHISNDIVQDLGCVPVKLIDKAECCSVSAGCNILRTVSKIPTVLDFNFDTGLRSIGDIDGDELYTESTYETIMWSRHNKYTGKLPRYFHKDGYIYVTNKDLSDYVRIRAVFEDPREAALFKTCDGDPCYNDDMDYPVAAWMIPVINELILSKELRIEALAANDEVNDARTTVEAPKRAQGRR